jgi:hypothetical protein
MSWRTAQPTLYMPTKRPVKLAAAEGTEDSSGQYRDDYSMDEYRDFVQRIADGEWPSETILNRSSDHAAVIVENLFRKAHETVEIVTSELKTEVYGLPAVISAAVAFLRRNEGAAIRILSEKQLDRATHPFFVAIAIDGEHLGDQVSVRAVDAKARQTYKFNFAVADAKSYRFEESRDSFEAIVGFGHEKFATRLHNVFDVLAITSA